MTPRFARAVDPVFNEVLVLLDRIHHGEQLEPREQRLVVRGLLEQGQAFVGTGREWELACYAMISWIDEMLVDSPWQGAEWWRNNVLEMELYNTRSCYEHFFVLAKEASTLPQRDALEVFYLCMMLGFRGLYHDPQLNQTLIESHGLPPDMEAWARQAVMSIQLGRGRPELARPTRELAAAGPVVTRAFPVWSWVLAAMAGITAVVWHFAA